MWTVPNATVVDYNLFLKFLIIQDVKYPAYARLQKIETQTTPVIQNKHEQVLHTCSVVCILWSPYMDISWQSADRKHAIFGCYS